MPDFIRMPDRSDIRDVYRYLIQSLYRLGATPDVMSCAAQLYNQAKMVRIIEGDVPVLYDEVDGKRIE